MTQLDWSHPPDPQTFASGQVHVWRTDCGRSPQDLAALRALLAPDEIQRAERFRFERDRHRYIVGRGTLRQILGAYLGRSPEQLQFAYGSRGKPGLVEASGLQFNLSHSEDWALYAIAHTPVGIDLEVRRPVSQMTSIVERYFSPQEQQFFSNLSPEAQTFAFFRAWTSKEAYLKAIGQGLTVPLHEIDLELDHQKPPRFYQLPQGQNPQHWPLWEFEPSPHLQAALTLEWKAEPLPSVTYGNWHPETGRR